VDDKPKSWFTFERACTVGAILISVGSLLTTVNAQGNRVAALESETRNLKEVMLEMKGDIKVLVERTNPRSAQP